jgi:hypothetical protein
VSKKGWDNPIKGELSPNAKLSNEAVLYIRRSSKDAYTLGKELGVSHTCVIARAKITWVHI